MARARLAAELPALKVSFVGAWEADLAAHHKAMITAQAATSKAQAAQRVAAAVLADAEAERTAAAMRREVAEKQLNEGIDGIIKV